MKLSPTQLPLINPKQLPPDPSAPNGILRELGYRDLVENRGIDSIRQADAALVDAGYEFIGYHGTNRQSLRSMCDSGIDPKFIGSGDGQAKGSGFYVARAPGKAMDYASSSTQAGDPVPPHYDIPRYPGERGIEELVRVYAKRFDDFQGGRDMAWGLECSDGDPNGDKRLAAAVGAHDAVDLELVIAPARFGRLAVLPSLHAAGYEASLSPMRGWPPHTEPAVESEAEPRRRISISC